MNPVRIFHHVDREPRSYLESYFIREGLPFEVVCLDLHLPVPMELDGLAGLVFLGGAGDVNQPTDFMIQEMLLIEQAARIGLPVMGICLGAQLISKALGGQVCRNTSLEVGWHLVQQTAASRQLPWFADLPDSFEVFQWHAHIYSMPPGGVVLAGNDCFSQQAYALDNILAMQFHLEMTSELVEFLIERFVSDLEVDSYCVQHASVIRHNMEQRMQRLHDTADRVYARWLQRVYPEAGAS
jgi:GMP synthase-like glutamine amidotransferase